MKLENVNLFLGNRFTAGDIEFDENIIKISKRKGRGEGYLLPGLVDIHSHGRMGADFSDGGAGTLPLLSVAYAQCGVTSFLATSMTLPKGELLRAAESYREFSRRGGAKCAGIHLEGPFLSKEKRGAHRSEYLCPPDLSLFEELQRASGDGIKIVTVAPELPGAMEFISAAAKSCVVSLGHTAASYEVCMRAFSSGASHVTHLFNAMPPFLHREPGLIGAAIEAGADAELICDGFHVHPAAVKGAFGMFGEKLCLISDSVRASGLEDGEYTLGSSPVCLRGGRVTTKDGTLAGSCISLYEGMLRAVSFGIPLERAVYAATTAPARAAKIKAGVLKEGEKADLLYLDGELNIRDVFIDGKKFIKGKN